MNKLILAIMLLSLTACSKPVEVPKAPLAVTAAVQVLPAPAPMFAPNPAFFTPVAKPAEAKPVVVKQAKQNKKHRHSAAWLAAERAAYAKAYKNAKRANDLLGRNAYSTGETNLFFL